MHFRFFRLRFHFTAQDALRFPEGCPANILRGALGCVFRAIACAPECESAATCLRRSSCVYARTFEPVLEHGPSGLADPPRPFVFRAAHLDGASLSGSESFFFDMHLFDVREPAIPWFVRTFDQIGREGLGPSRSIARLERVEALDEQRQVTATLFEDGCMRSSALEPLALPLDPGGEFREIEVRFLTPFELKSESRIAVRPEFSILMARVRDRLSTLAALYGDGPLPVDFAGFGERSRAVRLIDADIEPVEARRYSTRTRRTHPLGGFRGTVRYSGPLAEFVPFLNAARFTGVGRQTTWGKGEFEVRLTAD